MIHTDFMMEQIRRFLERLGNVRSAVQQGARAKAADDLEELLRDVSDFWERTAPEQRAPIAPVLAQVHSELGMVLAGAGALPDGLTHLERALDLLRPMVEQPDAEGRIVELFASVLLNAGATHAAVRDLETARDRLDEAMDRLAERPSGEEASLALTSLRVAALQNRAMVSQQRDDLQAARHDIERAVALVEQADASQPALIGLAVDLRHRLAVIHRRAGRRAEAVEAAREGLEAAESLAAEDWGPLAALWVRAKMIMAEVCFEAGFLGDGENHIFEAIESVPELIDPLLAGIELYLGLWKRSDDALETGGLPRDEVGDSLAELLAGLDARCADDHIRAFVWARYDLIVNGDRAPGERLANQGRLKNTDPRLAALRARLQSDLAS